MASIGGDGGDGKRFGLGQSGSALDGVADRVMAAMYAGELGKVEALLRDYPTLVDCCYGSEGYSPLAHAAGLGHLALVGFLVRAGAKINRSDNVRGRTPLHEAAADVNPKMVRFLLGKGARAGLRDRHGETPADLCRRQAGTAREFAERRDYVARLLGGESPRDSIDTVSIASGEGAAL
jgi:hypothetical protein